MTVAESRLTPGARIDPLAPGYVPPSLSALGEGWRSALASQEFAAYQRTLLLPGIADCRTAILDDLSTFYQGEPQECLSRCVGGDARRVSGWPEADAATSAGLQARADVMASSSFDLAWGVHLQAAGAEYPAAVVAARLLLPPAQAPRCLDVGAGAGDLAQLLVALGYTVDLAEHRRTLLKFARWRLERRGLQAGYLDLNDVTLPPHEYDAIMVHPAVTRSAGFEVTVPALHRALKPGGLLLARLGWGHDVSGGVGDASDCASDDVAHRRRLVQGVGFEPLPGLDTQWFVYRRVDTGSVGRPPLPTTRAVLFGPPQKLVRRLKRVAWQASSWRPRA